jgi:hypothetical protein
VFLMNQLIVCLKDKLAPYDVNVGRQHGPHHFGNPFSHKQSKFNTVRVRTATEAVERFRTWLAGETDQAVEPQRRQWILDNLPTLKGKVLGCWCNRPPCHAYVLCYLANGDQV